MLNVRLLGRFSAAFGTRLIALHDGSKAQELFAYLLLKRQQAHTREEVASVLWEDSPPRRSRAYLRKALWQLHTALLPPGGRGASVPLIEVDGDWLRIHPEAAIWLDVAVIENAHANSRGSTGTSLQRSAAMELSEAAALYTGDLLPNRYQSWCLEERERLKHLYLCMLEKLLEFSEVQGEYDMGLFYGRGILAYDATREHIHRQIMRMCCLRGDRASALHQYRQCVNVLASELGVPPMKETSALYEHIRGGDGIPTPQVDREVASAAALRDVINRLDHLQVALGELRRSAERSVRSSSSLGPAKPG